MVNPINPKQIYFAYLKIVTNLKQNNKNMSARKVMGDKVRYGVVAGG